LSQHEIIFIVCSFLFGFIPFGYIFYFLTGKKDVKGKHTGTVSFMIDMVKGIIVIVYGLRHFDSPIIVLLGGSAVIIGHSFPFYLTFKEGKGVAVLLGVFIVFDFQSVVVFAIVFFLTLFFTNDGSAGSIAGVTALFFFTLFTHIVEVSTIVLVVVLLIIGKHRSNIQQLTAGTEDKFNWKIHG